MSAWPSTRARRVLAALLRIGWVVKRQSSSHRTLSRPDWADFVFAFHDDEEIGPRMLEERGVHPRSQLRVQVHLPGDERSAAEEHHLPGTRVLLGHLGVGQEVARPRAEH